MQAIFLNVGRSTRAEVVEDIRLTIIPDGMAPRFLEYVEKSKTVWDASRREVHVEYADEASPVIVSQNTVRAEMLTFKTVEPSSFTPGNYSGILSGRLFGSRFIVSAPFTFSISESHVAAWRESGGHRFSMIPIIRAEHGRANSR